MSNDTTPQAQRLARALRAGDPELNRADVAALVATVLSQASAPSVQVVPLTDERIFETADAHLERARYRPRQLGAKQYDADGDNLIRFARALLAQASALPAAQQPASPEDRAIYSAIAAGYFRDTAKPAREATTPELLHACEQAVEWLEGWASAEPYVGVLRAAIAKAKAAQQPAVEPVAPPIEAAHAMGASGSPPVEAERLAFEAWMRGHCWALSATWTGTQYLGSSESSGYVCPRAMGTRRMWAAWRDRAALASPTAQPAAPDVVADARRWQPIETAPREHGKLLLGWVWYVKYDEDDDGYVTERQCGTVDFIEWQDGGEHGEGYWMAMAGPWGDSADGISNWQPLPPPLAIDAELPAEGQKP